MTRAGTLLPGRRPGSGGRGWAADARAIGSLASVHRLRDKLGPRGGRGNSRVGEIYAASPGFLHTRDCNPGTRRGLQPPAPVVRPSWRRGAPKRPVSEET